MTLLGVRWSEEARPALGLVDLIEINGWTAREGLPAAPTLLHNLDLDFSLMAPGIATEEWVASINAAIRATGSRWFSLHLGFSAERVRFDDGMRPLSPILDRATCLKRVVDAARFAWERLEVPLLLENLDYCLGGAYEHICEPDFIREALEASGCGLLLDLAHLRVSADRLGFDPLDYLNRLPLERLVELHLSGPRRVDGCLEDVHREIGPEDEELLQRVFPVAVPSAVVLEYSRDSRLLYKQLERLRDILGDSGTIVAPTR